MCGQWGWEDGRSSDEEAGSESLDLLGKSTAGFGDRGDYGSDKWVVKGLPYHDAVKFGKLKRLGAPKKHQ